MEKILFVAGGITIHILLMNSAFAEDSINLPDLTITGENEPARPNKVDLEQTLSDESMMLSFFMKPYDSWQWKKNNAGVLVQHLSNNNLSAGYP